MKLELPPERPLPRAEWMVERILADSSSSAAGRERARIYWIGGLVAAAVTVTAAVIGWAVLIPTGQSQVGAPPATTAAPSSGPPSTIASPTPSQLKSSPAAASPTIRPSSGRSTSASRRPPPTAVASQTPTPTQSISTPAETTQAEQASTPPAGSEPPVTTTVPIGVRVQAPYLDLTASGTMRGGDVYAVLVETCVRSLLPDSSEGLVLSRSSWTLSTSQGTVGTDAPITDPISLPTSYPEEGIYLVGECAQGWIPFGVGPDTTVTAIRYRNSLGGDVTWNPNT